MADLFDLLDEPDPRERPWRWDEPLPCGCPPESECNGWHWAREEWDDCG